MPANEIAFSICVIGLAITEIASACCICICKESPKATPSKDISEPSKLITEAPTPSTPLVAAKIRTTC